MQHAIHFLTASFVNNDFELLVDTAEVGLSNNDQFALSFNTGSTNNFDYEMDGVTGTHTTDADLTITAPSGAGIYTFKILAGGACPQIKFNDTGDAEKVLAIQNWGDISVESWNSAYNGCDNLVITATDEPNGNLGSGGHMLLSFQNANALVNAPFIETSLVTTFEKAYSGCDLLETVPFYDMSSNLSMRLMFSSCNSLLTLPLYDTSTVTNWQQCFSGCTTLQTSSFDFTVFNYEAMTNGTVIFNSLTLDTSIYDALLIQWDNGSHQPNVTLGAGNSQYSAGAPATARANRITDGWTITDGGPA